MQRRATTVEEAVLAKPESSQPAWRKSTRSLNGDCVEIAITNTIIWIRDSKDPDGVKLSFAADNWRHFIAGLVDEPNLISHR
jgi:hypothetical protein